MKKILSLGLILGLCTSFMVGCTKKMDESRMIECKKYEDKLPDTLETLDYIAKEMADNCDNFNGYKSILSNQEWISTYDEEIKSLSLEDLELYHENLKKYNDVKDDNFQDVKYLYLLCQRKLSYCKEIISLCEDKEISSEDELKIQKLGTLSSIIANKDAEDSFAHSKKLIELQKQMDEKYKLDSDELYLLQGTKNG